MSKANPFYAGTYNGHHCYHQTVPDRISAVADFIHIEDCKAALDVPGIQKAVVAAIERRIRKLTIDQGRCQ